MPEAFVELVEIVTGDADVGGLDLCVTDFEDVVDLELGEVQALGGEVFADGAVGEVDLVLGAESGVEFFGVEADGAVGAAVVFFVALLVAFYAGFGDEGAMDGALGHAAGGDV